jgi:hypothetical protein
MLDMRGLVHKREKWSFNKDGNEIERSNWDGVSWYTIRRPLARDGIFSGVVLLISPFGPGGATKNQIWRNVRVCVPI